MRVATIDIGTNSVLLLVAEVTAGGEAKAVLERATITRLGQGVDQTRRLAPEAVARTRACLESYADEVKRAGAERVRIVGTSALRDAAGSDELRAMVEARFHAPLEVISGGDEARLTFEGALAGLPARASEVVVFDIGGGSTEVVQGISTARGPRIWKPCAPTCAVGSRACLRCGATTRWASPAR